MTQIEYVKIEDIIPNPKNRNIHPVDQIKRLSDLIKFNGFRQPVIISKRSGLLVSGHARIQAAKKLGIHVIPAVFHEFKSEEEEYAFGISDNAIASWSELDLSNINIDISDLGPDFDIDLLGIKDFTIEFADKLAPGCDEDDVPEQVEPKSKRGDIYQLGPHRLMCGDSTMIDDVEKLMGGHKADMVFTDPPYGVSYQSNMRTKSDRFDVIENDDTLLSEWINALPIVSIGWVFIWTTWRVIGKWIEITTPIGAMTNLIVWDKGGGGMGDLSKTFLTDHELALVFNRGANITGKRLGSVWSIGKDRGMDYVHPTQKPVELGQIAFENCTNIGACVLDLFGGSGSTLIACEKTGRKCFMMELDTHYCDVIVARWEKYTGKTAELLVN